MRRRDAPLGGDIEGKQLVIRIGINCLKFAAEHCPLLYDGTVENADPPYCKVTDKNELAHDVKRMLFGQREDGSSPISDLLDKAIINAMEDGSLAFDEDE